MFEIEYTTNTPETANATFDFMTNRPILAIMFSMMKISCFILCMVFAICWYNKALRPQDYVAICGAIAWLFFYKQINRQVISSALKKRKFTDLKCVFRFDEKSIFFMFHNREPQHVEWKKLKYVLKNKDGYIIPLTGIVNAGKFLWLPLRSLHKPSDEQAFLDYVGQFKLKLKKL